MDERSTSKKSLLALFLEHDKGKHKADLVSSSDGQAFKGVEKITQNTEKDASKNGTSGVPGVESMPSKKRKHSALEQSEVSMTVNPSKLLIT